MNEEENKNSKIKLVWKGLSFKTKLIIIGIAITIFFFLVTFIVLFTVFVEEGLIKIDDSKQIYKFGYL